MPHSWALKLYFVEIIIATCITLLFFQFETVPDTTGFSNSVTLKGFSIKTEVKPNTSTSTQTVLYCICAHCIVFFHSSRKCWKQNVSPLMRSLLLVSWVSSALTLWDAASARWLMPSLLQKMKCGTQTSQAMTVGWWETNLTSCCYSPWRDRDTAYLLLLFSSFVVYGRRGICWHHQRLQHCKKGTHHVYRHQPIARSKTKFVTGGGFFLKIFSSEAD